VLQWILVTNLTTATPVVYTLSISVLNRKCLKKTLKKIPDNIYQRKTLRIRRLCAYTCRLLSYCQQGEAESKKYILYMNVFCLGNDHPPSAPSTVRPSVLSVLSLIVKIKSEIWSKQQKPFVMRNSFCWATQVFKQPCQIVWQPYTVAKLNKEKLSELYHSLCRGRQEMTRNPAAWNLCSWHLILTKFICAGAYTVCSYCLWDRWHWSSNGLDASVDKASACFHRLFVKVWLIFAPSENACLEESVPVKKRRVL